MATIQPAYNNYSLPENNIFTSPLKLPQDSDEAIFSCVVFSTAGFCQQLLQEMHNEAVKKNSCTKGWTLAAIEMGFASNILLGSVESVLRIAFAAILLVAALFVAPFDCCKQNSLSIALAACALLNFIATPLTMAQSAISTYSNLAYMNQKIDYEGQAALHIFRVDPN
jgi:hypothetical protein